MANELVEAALALIEQQRHGRLNLTHRVAVEITSGTDDDFEPTALPSLNPVALYGPAGEFVRAVEPHTEADPVALLVQALVAFGNCAGRSAYVQVGATRHSANLFALLIGGTSRGRKGQSWAEVSRLFKAVDEGWHGTQIKSGLSSGEGLIWAVRDPIERQEPVREKGRIIDYQTVQADAGIADKRILVIESEFAATLKVMARDGNILSAAMRQAWDDGTLRILSKNSPAQATESHISIIGHITGAELRRQLTKTDAANGFANRFLFVHVQRSKLLPEGGGVPDLAGVVHRFRDALEFARTNERIERDEPGREIWSRAYAYLTAPRTGLLGAATGRAESQVLRLSLSYALLDCSPTIRVEHIAAAIAVWDYCESSAAYALGAALGDPVADELLKILSTAPDGLSKTDIRDHFSHHAPHKIDQALAMLSELKLARSTAVQTGGRPKSVWKATKATEASKGRLLSLLSLSAGSEASRDDAY